MFKHFMVSFFFSLFALLLSVSSIAQEPGRPLTKSVIVKTNLLSLIAQRPSFTLEKIFPNGYSAEFSFVQGQFNNILFTDHYDYNGFLIRAKKFLISPDFGKLSPYAAIYAGTLRRNIYSTGGQIGNNTWLNYPSRDFSANSIRGGGSLGLSYIAKNKMILDGQMSLGYGTYTKVYKPDINRKTSGYLDAQIWLSIGYCF